MLLMSNTMTWIIRLFELEICSMEIPPGPTDLPPLKKKKLKNHLEISTVFV